MAVLHFLPWLLALAPVALRAQQDSTPLVTTLPVDSAVTVGTLDNGLRYYLRVNHEPERRAELRLVVNAGSVLEDDDQQGLAHFVEHMAFSGTKHFAKQDLEHYMELHGMRSGPDLNASTGFDETVYNLTVPTDTPAIVEEAFQILEDWARYLTFDADQIERERGVVIGEWREGRGADARIRDRQFPVLFKGSRYAERLPIGRKERLEHLDTAALRRFYTDWYRPDLMAVVAVGDFDRAKIEGLIRQHFAGIPTASTPRPRPLVAVPDNDTTLYAIATDKEATTSTVTVYYKQPLRAHGTVGAYRQDLVEQLYHGMLNARLYDLTQKNDPPFVAGFSGEGRLVRSSEMYAMTAITPDTGIERGLETLLTEAERVSRFGFTAAELEREKMVLLRMIEHTYAEREKTNSAVYAAEYIRSYLWGDPIPGIDYQWRESQRLVPGIGLEDVNRLARTWVIERNRVVVVGMPEKEGTRVPSDTSLRAVFVTVKHKSIEPYTEAATGTALVAHPPSGRPVVKEEIIPEIGVREWRLANGVRVILKRTDFKNDEILFAATSPGGTSLAPDSLFVPAVFAAVLVGSSGVGAYNAIDLPKNLAGREVFLQPTLDSVSAGLTGRASTKDAEILFQLVYLYFTAPRLDSASYLAVRSQLQTFLENRSADPNAAFADTIQVTLAQHHFRARPLTSTVLTEMNHQRSLAFYRDRFADAGNFTFVLVGSFQPESIKPLVQSYLGGLPAAGRRETWRDVGMRPPGGVIRRVVRRGVEPMSRTEIAFTGAFEDTQENRYALRALGDVVQLMLRDRLREQMGATYGVTVDWSTAHFPQQLYSFTVSFGTAPERLDSLVQVVFRQIDSLKLVGPSASDVQKVMEEQRRELENWRRQNDYWLEELLVYTEDRDDLRSLARYGELIDRLDASLVRGAARRYLNADHYVEVSLYPETP